MLVLALLCHELTDSVMVPVRSSIAPQCPEGTWICAVGASQN